ncbi:MAG: hypothetical protein LBI61_03490 [Puniceicoccales bacterium]|nr:hypothetical protein [Puniceicoccales bacterium]
MKKLSMMLVGLLGAASLAVADDSPFSDDLSLETGIKFESEHVFRGRREMRNAFVPHVALGYRCIEDAEIYVGLDAALAAKAHSMSGVFNSFSPCVGLEYDITDMFTVDVGYCHHFYPSIDEYEGEMDDYIKDNVKKNSGEIYAGLLVDVLLSPKAYISYDFTRRELAIEGHVGYYFDLSDHLLSGLGIDLGAKLGYCTSSRPYGLNKDDIAEEGTDDITNKKDYFYYGAAADLVYELNSNAKVKIGVACEGNSAKRNSWPNFWGAGDKKVAGRSSLWFNTSVDCSF